jgi:hypothetical protein
VSDLGGDSRLRLGGRRVCLGNGPVFDMRLGHDHGDRAHGIAAGKVKKMIRRRFWNTAGKMVLTSGLRDLR